MNAHSFVTADDFARILREYPKGARGRRHLEAMALQRRTEQLRREIDERRIDLEAGPEALERELAR